MYIATNAAGSFAPGLERFGYREALAEVIAELGQAAVARRDHPTAAALEPRPAKPRICHARDPLLERATGDDGQAAQRARRARRADRAAP